MLIGHNAWLAPLYVLLFVIFPGSPNSHDQLQMTDGELQTMVVKYWNATLLSLR
jgi:hypothetical protein